MDEFSVCGIGQIDCHSVENYQDTAPETMSIIENWVDLNHDTDDLDTSDNDWDADEESDI